MVESIVVALLSALGVVLLFWCIVGILILPAGGEGYSVLFARDSEQDLRRIRASLFLRHSGLCTLPLLVVNCGLSETFLVELSAKALDSDSFRLLSPQEWEDFIETERNGRVSGT